MPRAPAPRRIDRQRRSRIIDATIDVLDEHGVQGLRHRRVATRAGVPLGATTYYFASLDELLVAAMTRAVENDLAVLSSRLDQTNGIDDVIDVLAETITEAADRGRRGAVVLSELYTAAFRNDALQTVALAWDDGYQALLAPRLGEVRSRAVGAAVGGLVQQALIHREQLSLADSRELIRTVLPAELSDREGRSG